MHPRELEYLLLCAGNVIANCMGISQETQCYRILYLSIYLACLMDHHIRNNSLTLLILVFAVAKTKMVYRLLPHITAVLCSQVRDMHAVDTSYTSEVTESSLEHESLTTLTIDRIVQHRYSKLQHVHKSEIALVELHTCQPSRNRREYPAF